MATMQGYSLCKIVSFGQKLKSPKICEKRLFKHNEVVVCRRQLEKTFNIREMRRWIKMGKNGHYARAVAFGKWLVWVTN